MNINFRKIFQIKILFTLFYLSNSSNSAFKDLSKLPLNNQSQYKSTQATEESDSEQSINQINDFKKIQQIQEFNFDNIYECLEIIKKKNIGNQINQAEVISNKINNSNNDNGLYSLEKNEASQNIIDNEDYQFIHQSMKIINQNNEKDFEKIKTFIEKMEMAKFIEFNDNNQGDNNLYLLKKDKKDELNNLKNEIDKIKFKNNLNDLIKLTCIQNALNIINSEYYFIILNKFDDQEKNNNQLELSIIPEQSLEDSNLAKSNISNLQNNSIDEFLGNINYQFNLYKLFKEDKNQITIIEYIEYIEYLSIDLEKTLVGDYNSEKIEELEKKIKKNLEKNIKAKSDNNKKLYFYCKKLIAKLIIEKIILNNIFNYNYAENLKNISFLNKNNQNKIKENFLKLKDNLNKPNMLFKVAIGLTFTGASVYFIKKQAEKSSNGPAFNFN